MSAAPRRTSHRLQRTATPHPGSLAELLSAAAQEEEEEEEKKQRRKPAKRLAPPSSPPNSPAEAGAEAEERAEERAEEGRRGKRQRGGGVRSSGRASGSASGREKKSRSVEFSDSLCSTHSFPDEDPDHRRPSESSGLIFCSCKPKRGTAAQRGCLCSADSVPPCHCAVEGVRCHPRWGSVATVMQGGAQLKCLCTFKACGNPHGNYYLDLAEVAKMRAEKLASLSSAAEEAVK